MGGRAADPITTASTDAGGGYDLVSWTRAFGAWGQYDAANADRDLGGFVTGVDAGLPGGWRAGLATGYLRTNLSTDQHSSAEIDSYVLGAYAGGGLGDGFALRLADRLARPGSLPATASAS
jgi:outer membrane autotransporter protein